ncbi:MAG: hypothetical protein J6C64_08230 [Lachnospiraceae bacterium]|nr:hypothetical protein [Lachnospiraceae bacterium]
MISKNSFLASLKENSKRRIWLWLLSALSYLVIFPTAVAMAISRGKRSEEYLIESLGEALGRQALQEQLIKGMEQFFGITNPVMWLVIAAFAVVSAIQGFSYLYSKKKIDFYMGMPVKRSRRFCVIWLNGILIYLIPYFTGLLIAGLIAAVNGVMTASVLREAALAYGIYLCFFLGVYHLTILAVMLTGNVIITCFGTAVFFLYEWCVRLIIQSYQALFFKFYSYSGNSAEPLFSPFTILLQYAGKHENGQGSGLSAVVYLLLFAVIVGAVAYICYLKRPAEAAGKAMAFTLPQPIIKILLVVPVTLLAGCLVSDIVGYSPIYGEGKEGFIIFAMAVVLIVSSCLIQILYEFDIKGILHKKHHIFISAVAVVIVFLIFRYDLLGYDSYIPKADSVASAAFVPPYEYRYYGGDNYFSEDMEHISKISYVEENMYLSDVGAVNKLMKLSIDEMNKYDNLSQLFNEENDDSLWYKATVIFRMDNKRNVYRDIYVNVNNPEVAALLDRIEASDEYISGINMGASELLAKILADDESKAVVSYGDNYYQQKLSSQEAEEFLALYIEDVKGIGFTKLRESIPCGSLRFSIVKKYLTHSSYFDTEFPIYPFHTRCVEYLKEHGYYRESFINPEDVERIQVTNYNMNIAAEKQKQWQEQLALDSDVSVVSESAWSNLEYSRYASYDSLDDISELCNALYPQDWLSQSWHMGTSEDTDYSITVYFKSDSQPAKDNMSVGTYCFKAEEVPQFVIDDTVYRE